MKDTVNLHNCTAMGRTNHMAEAAYAAGPTLLSILGRPVLS